MPFDVRLIGYAKKDGAELLRMEPPWWDSDQVLAFPGLTFAKSHGADVYRDFDVDLSVDEARDLHSAFRVHAFQPLYECPEWQVIIGPLVQRLDDAFGQDSSQFSHFHVRVYEWESGL